MEITGRVVVITGASAGLGEAISRLFASEGAHLALVARSADTLNRLADELPDTFVVPTDMRDAAAIAHMIEAVHARTGRIDLLINNAGQGMYSPIGQTSLDQYRYLMDLNLYGPLLAMQAVIPIMRTQGGGMILNVSSPLGKIPLYLPGLGAYASTKAALITMTLTARAELLADNIRVGIIYPGMMATDFDQHSLRGAVSQSNWSSGASETPAGIDIPPDAPAPQPLEVVAAKVLEAVQHELSEQYTDPTMQPGAW